MSVDLTVQTWLTENISTWIDRLDLEAWDVQVRLEMVVNDNPDCMAHCDRTASYNVAKMTFRADIEDTPYWRKIVLHEMLHIVLARMDQFVFDALIPDLDTGATDIASRGYTFLNESAVQNLTTAFWRVFKLVDIPEDTHANL